MALPRKNRLTARKDFQLVFERGKTVKDSFFFIKYSPNQLNRARWGIIVSAKVSPKSVVRNRLKRIISGILRQNDFLNFPFDVIINTSPIILNKSSNEIKGRLEQAIKKINVNL